jgi:hypothetical protein
MEPICPICHNPLQPTWYFCPNCGKNLKEKPFSISILKQIFIYSVSFFLTPLGLTWGIKYVRSPDPKVRTVGIISIFFTVISLVLMIIVFKNFIDQYSKILNNISGSGNNNNINDILKNYGY